MIYLATLAVVKAANFLAANPKCDSPGKIEALKSTRFLGLKPWYAYSNITEDCAYRAANADGKFGGTDVWPIAAVVFEDVLIVASYVALGFVLYGAFQMITAQGEPDKFKNARGTLINALIGLVIALVGGRLVGFIFNGVFK